MSRWHSRFGLGLVCAFVCGVARAGVWTVDDDGPANFTQIQAAIDAASDGDVVLVMPGTYSGFTITAKGVVVIGWPSAPPALTSNVTVQSTSTSQTVVLATFADPVYPWSALAIGGCAGPVRVQDCRFRAPYVTSGAGIPGTSVGASNNVVVSRCTSTGGKGDETSGGPPWWASSWGGGAGALASQSSIAIWDSSLLAGAPYVSNTVMALYGQIGGAGLKLRGSFAFASGAQLIAGKGGSHSLTSTMCSQAGGAGTCGPGGNGLWLTQSASSVHVLKPDLTAGEGGTSNCYWYFDGPDGKSFRRDAFGSTAARVPGVPRKLSMPALLAGVSSASVTFTGVAGDVVYFVHEPQPQFVYSAAMHGVWTLTYPPAQPPALGVIGAGGTLATTFVFPSLQPGETERTEFVQAYHVDALGAVYAGTPWSITLVP